MNTIFVPRGPACMFRLIWSHPSTVIQHPSLRTHLIHSGVSRTVGVSSLSSPLIHSYSFARDLLLRTGQLAVRQPRRKLQILRGVSLTPASPAPGIGWVSTLLGGASVASKWAFSPCLVYCREAGPRTVVVGPPDARVRGAAGLSGEQSLDFPWWEFLRLLRPDALLLAAAVVSALVVAFINVQVPIALGRLVNVISQFTQQSNNGTSSSGSATSVDSEAVHSYAALIRDDVLHLVGLYLVQGVFTFAYIAMLSHVGERAATRLWTEIFSSVLAREVAFFDTTRTGDIVTRLTADVQDTVSPSINIKYP